MTKLSQILPSATTFENETFENIGKVHDWRNYVGPFKECWNELTLREKQIIYVMADELASMEEWD